MLEVDHPQYPLHLHNGQEINTAIMPVGLMPRYTLGYFPPDADDPFKDLQMKRGERMGPRGFKLMPRQIICRGSDRQRNLQRLPRQTTQRFLYTCGTRGWKELTVRHGAIDL